MNDSWSLTMNRLIDITTQCRNEQEEIDNVYSIFVIP